MSPSDDQSKIIVYHRHTMAHSHVPSVTPFNFDESIARLISIKLGLFLDHRGFYTNTVNFGN